MSTFSTVSVLAVLGFLVTNLHLSVAQFGTTFPFNMVPGGLRIPFIGGGGYASPAIGQGLSFAGQNQGWNAPAPVVNQGWRAPVPVVSQPVGWQAPVPIAPRPVGWNAQPVVQQPVGWNVQPVPQPVRRPVGWNAQPIVQQPVGWGAQAVAQPIAQPAQHIGWNARPIVVAPPPVVQSGWGSSVSQIPQVVPQSQTVNAAAPAINIPTAPVPIQAAPNTAPLTSQPIQVPTFQASPAAITTSSNAAYSK